MKKRQNFQYTIRQVPERVDTVLREKAAGEGISLNDAALAALSRGAGVSEEEVRYHDLDDLAGTWVDDSAFDEAVREMDRIDPDLWK